MRARKTAAMVIAVAFAAECGAAAAHADAVADFYKRRQVSLIVGYGPGGGYDTAARLLARHLGRYLPGNPTIVAQNMPGAGSMRAANYVYSVAPKDGTVIAAVNQNMPMYQMLGGAGAQFNAAAINWLGSMAYSNGTLYTLAKSGIAMLDDEPIQVKPRGSNCTLGLFAMSPMSAMSLPKRPKVAPSRGATE